MVVLRECTYRSDLIISLSHISLLSSRTQVARMVDDYKIVPIFCNLLSSNAVHIHEYILWAIYNLLGLEESYIILFLKFGGLEKLLRMKQLLYDNDDDNEYDDIVGLIIETYNLTNRAKILASAA